MRLHTMFSAALILATCGLALPARAALDEPPHDRQTQPDGKRAMAGTSFVSADKCRGMSVRNSADESLGTITDLVIERGTGRIAYVVLKTGATLGIGGKEVVVPYSVFGWDNADKHVTLASTPDQVKAWPEFESDRWKTRDQQENALVRSLSSQYFKDSARTPAYPNASGEDDRVRGRVTRISRQSVSGYPDQTVLTVTTDEGKTEKVIVGPTWYLVGSSAPIYRDAPIDLYATRGRTSDSPMIARRVSVNSRETRLYNDKGEPTWGYRTDGPNAMTGVTPFVLSSELDGKAVECRGEKCGKIDDLVIECVSGRVAFISVDPDQNVLGIGDTKRLAPWSTMAAATQEAVMLDASKAMITSAEKTPSDLHTLSTANMYRNAYPGYDVPVETFETVRR